MIQCAFAYHNLATGNIFDSPDGVMHRASKERNGGGKNPMIRPLQNNRDKIWDFSCKQTDIRTLFPFWCGVWQIACEQISSIYLESLYTGGM